VSLIVINCYIIMFYFTYFVIFNTVKTVNVLKGPLGFLLHLTVYTLCDDMPEKVLNYLSKRVANM